MTRRKRVKDSKQEQHAPALAPVPRKRFRLEKLEERIAPKGHYNPQSKWVGGGGGSVIASTGGTGSIY